MSSPKEGAQSPPQSASDPSRPVVVPLPVIQQQDDIYYYVFVRGSLYSPESAVFGLEMTEISALSNRFGLNPKEIENGVMFKKPVNTIINSLAQLGYRVISTCGETEHLFTLGREI
jgi:hypothetical protein